MGKAGGVRTASMLGGSGVTPSGLVVRITERQHLLLLGSLKSFGVLYLAMKHTSSTCCSQILRHTVRFCVSIHASQRP
jgi:hypothetical protein